MATQYSSRPTSATSTSMDGDDAGDNSRSILNGSFFSRSFDTSVSSPTSTKSKDVRDVFTKLDVASKTMMYEAFQTLHVLRDREAKANGSGNEWMESPSKIYTLISQIKGNLEEMKTISDDMNAVKELKVSSPRIVDQAKTYVLSVESLKASLRQLQMEFQLALSSRQRQDLFSLSRSPFEDGSTNGVRRRAGGAAEVSSGATESMLHSRRILLETVQRSAGTIGQLANSSTTIQDNQEELKGQNSLISVSKKLLGKYGKREWTDRVLICLALVFFLAVVLYVIQKRLF